MKNCQRRTGDERGTKTGKSVLAGFLALCPVLLLLGCPGVFEGPMPGKTPPGKTPQVVAGQGYFSLALGEGAGRTILPVSDQQFAAYTLEFYYETQNPADFRQAERTSGNLSEPVPLNEGTWTLLVTAYMDTGKTKPAAQGSAEDILIEAGKVTSRGVILEPINDGAGEGSFSWDISYPSTVNSAVMTITRLPVSDSDTPITITLSGGSSADTVTLTTGYYRVVLKLKTPEGQEAERWEILHVYQNMVSTFEYTFNADQFHRPLVPPTIYGNLGNYRFGLAADGKTNIYTQAVWELSADNLALAKTEGTKLELVLSADPYATLQLAWNGPDNDLWWQDQTDVLENFGYAIYETGATWNAGTKTLGITLSKAFGENSVFADEPSLHLIIAYYGGDSINDLGIVSANLVPLTVPDITGNLGNYRFGLADMDTKIITQAVWELSADNLALAQTPGTILELGLSADPFATLHLAWQGPDSALWWQDQTTILEALGDVSDWSSTTWDANTKTLAITLSNAFGGNSIFADEPSLNLVIAYFGGGSVNDLGIVSANLFPLTLPDITGNLGNYRFGLKADGVTNNITQATWELSVDNVALAKTTGTKLELVLSEAPSASMQLVWQGPDTGSWWNEADILGEFGDAIAGTGAVWDASANTLTITLSEALVDYSVFTAQPSLNLLIAYYGGRSVNDLGIVSANLVGSAQGTGSFTITFAGITDSAPLIVDQTISRSGANGPKTVTLNADNPGQYASIEWSVTGTPEGGTGASFILDSANAAYNSVGEHFLTVEVWKNGTPYNKTITFMVTD